MALSLKPEHLKRYADIARLLIQHGRSDLVKAVEVDLPDDEVAREAVAGDPEKLAKDLEAMGPTFIKLGQLLSTRSDLLPAALSRRAGAPAGPRRAFPFGEVEEIVVDRARRAHLQGVLATSTRSPSPRPRWGRSTGRRCATAGRSPSRCSGRASAQLILEDLEALEQIAAIVDKHTEVGRRFGFQDMLEEFRKTLLRELDYRREARNLVTLADEPAPSTSGSSSRGRWTTTRPRAC